MRNLRDTVGRAGLLNASSMLKDLDRNLKDRGDNAAGSLVAAHQLAKANPCGSTSAGPGGLGNLGRYDAALAAPVTTTAVVIIFLIFFLFQREDLRNRFIRLAGTDDLGHVPLPRSRCGPTT